MERRDEAVSPVVGVMLMLVVTIIIAAVVSGFAGGLVKSTEKAPQASFECSITRDAMGYGGYELTMKHLSGDPINTHDLKLVTSWVDASGVFHVQETVAPAWVETEEVYYNANNATNSSHYNLTSLNTHYIPYGGSGEVYYHEPYKVIAGDMPANNAGEEETLWFGNYIMRAGDVIKGSNINMNPGTGDLENQATPIIKDVENLTPNDIVNVKLIHLPSGSTIFNKNVVVEG